MICAKPPSLNKHQTAAQCALDSWSQDESGIEVLAAVFPPCFKDGQRCHAGNVLPRLRGGTVHLFQPLQSLPSLYLAVISKCCYLFPISLKLRANSLDIHREIGASASQGNKGLMRARIGVKPRSKNITSGCLVSLSPSATLHRAMAFHNVLSINTSCKSSGSGSAAWFQEGNRKLGSLWKI